jgi:hypothetical protein
MNPADAEAAKLAPTKRPSASAAAGFIDTLDEQLRVSVDALLHLSPAPNGVGRPSISDQSSPRRRGFGAKGNSPSPPSNRKRDGKSSLGRVRPLPGRDLYCCCCHLGVAILRRCSKADSRDKNPGIRLVAANQASDCGLDAATWLDETAGRRKQSGTGDQHSARVGRPESAHRPYRRPGAAAANGPESRSIAGQRRENPFALARLRQNLFTLAILEVPGRA